MEETTYGRELMTREDCAIRASVAQALRDVVDPELFVSIVDLGLLYNIFVDEQSVRIQMTLTSLGCPLFSVIQKEVTQKALSAAQGRYVSIDVVFDPIWNLDMVSIEARAELGL